MEKIASLDHVLIPKTVQRTLAINNITTILEFLQQDAEKLSTLTKLSLSQILDIRNDIFNKFSATVIDGPSLFTMYKNKQRFINTGIDRYLRMNTFSNITFYVIVLFMYWFKFKQCLRWWDTSWIYN